MGVLAFFLCMGGFFAWIMSEAAKEKKQPGPSTYGGMKIQSITGFDGEFLSVNFDGPGPDVLTKNIPVRINGIGTPKGKSEQETAFRFAIIQWVTATISRAKKIELVNVGGTKKI